MPRFDKSFPNKAFSFVIAEISAIVIVKSLIN